MKLEASMDEMKNRIARMEQTILEKDEEVEKLSAEMLGIKLSLAHLSAFLPMTLRDATSAREQAIALAEDATSDPDTPPEQTLVVFSTITAVFAMAGEIWRNTKG